MLSPSNLKQHSPASHYFTLPTVLQKGQKSFNLKMMSSHLSFSFARLAPSTITKAANARNYTSLRTIHISAGVLEVTIHSPNSEINLFDSAMLRDFQSLVASLQHDNITKVVVFKSDIPKYFIAHADLYEQPFGKSFPILSFPI